MYDFGHFLSVKRHDFKSDKEDYKSMPLYFCLILRQRGKMGWEKREA